MFEAGSPVSKYFSIAKMMIEALPEEVLSWFGSIFAGVIAACLLFWIMSRL